MPEDMVPVTAGTLMEFRCSPENECFNDCCRDLNQVLTPYDIVRLRKNLGMRSQDFLKNIPRFITARNQACLWSGLNPIPGPAMNALLSLRKGVPSIRTGLLPAGCILWPGPLPDQGKQGGFQSFFALIEEPHCKGFGAKTGLTVQEWLKGQDVQRHNAENDKLMDLISLKNRILPGKLEGDLSDKFYLGLYDLDEFRSRILSGKILGNMKVPETVLTQIQTDDEALLDFGMAWVRFVVFGIQLSGD